MNTSSDQPVAATTPTPAAANAPAETVEAEPAFFSVSLKKLSILSFCSLGLYELYWFYKHWKRVDARERYLSPFWRTFFTLFFCYSLFTRVRDYPSESGNSSLAAGGIATGFIVGTVAARLPEPYWLISLFGFVFLIPVQRAANRINEELAPGHDRNEHFSAGNWVAIVLGGALVILAIYGTFLPPEP